jgi:septal ring factor EnvC (AmiA/AmiB activator)
MSLITVQQWLMTLSILRLHKQPEQRVHLTQMLVLLRNVPPQTFPPRRMMRRSSLKATAARVHACWCAERAAVADRSAHRSRRLKQETQNLEVQKQAIIAQANAQKALLAKEIKSLRAEVEKVPGGGAGRE